MNWNDYRRAVDALPVSPDFRERTLSLVRERCRSEQQNVKEYSVMKKRFLPRLAAAVLAAALLAASAFAAVRLLSPGEVADMARYPVLAEAFKSRDAVILNESVETGDFRVTLTGLVSGKGLTEWKADQDRTYAVVALERLDGAPLGNPDFPFTDYMLTPLVGGFTPWSVNSLTLGASAEGLDRDGVYYYLLDTKDIEMFADHTVYLAFYEGFVPSRDMFVMGEDGTIAFAGDFEGPHALFTLPLEAGKADPDAVEAFMAGSGFDREWFYGLPIGDAPAGEDVPGDGALLPQ